jgi:predicted transcriptional regulator
MNPSTKEILRRVDAWPAEDQEELLEAAMEIEARRVDVYQLDDDERAAIERGLADMREGRFATDEAIAAIFRKARAKPA